MANSSYVTVKVDAQLAAEVRPILKSLGYTNAEIIRMAYRGITEKGEFLEWVKREATREGSRSPATDR